MESLLTSSNITFVIGIIGVIFTVFFYFKNPQDDLEKLQAVSQVAVDGKAALLAEQVKWEREGNEKKFTDFGVRLDSAMTLAQNHVHSVDVKVDGLTAVVNQMGNEIVKLRTIIEERIPAKR